MYLVGRHVLVLCSWSCAQLGRRRRQQPAHLFEILRRVDADRVVRGFDGLDADAVLERAQLLERFGPLERRRLERRQHEQGAAAIRVEADMSVERRPAAARIAGVRNGRAREVQREAAAIDDDLDDVRVGELGRVVDAPVERRHLTRRGRRERRDRLVDGARVEQRLVALHVDDDVAVERRGDLGEPIGAGLDGRPASAARRRRTRATRVAIRRSSVATMTRDDRPATRRHAPVDVLDHRTAVDVGERLCREAASRRIERG